MRSPASRSTRARKPLAFSPGEVITEGLDGLRQRLIEYRGLGAKFAKWRAVIDIGEGIPSYAAIITNAHALARYAALCQEEGIVPIVEPEVLMDGDHDADRCYVTSEWLLKTVFEQLYCQKVALEGMVLKPNMVIAGKKAKNRAGVEEVAEKTVKVLKACVPAAVPGIAFLSGGQSDEEATAHLDAMNRIGGLPVEAHLQLRPRAAGGAAEGLGREARERRRGATRLRPPRHDEQPRRDGAVEAGSGEEGGVRRHTVKDGRRLIAAGSNPASTL